MITLQTVSAVAFTFCWSLSACHAEEALTLSKEERQLLDSVNAERKKADLPPLKPNAKLFQAAREHSANMAKQEKLDHELDGKNPGDRITAAGYAHAGWGENVAGGQEKVADAMETWLNSEPHKANLLSKTYVDVGLAVATSTSGKRYWTQVFAAPK